ncbi:MAG: fused MFS/spermidine synthase [bacterium]
MTVNDPGGPPSAAAPPAEAPRLGWLWRPNLIVFVSSACIMILELVAGRILAPQVGVSLYTWTTVIGIVLAGISLGNYAGGRLADRRASLRLLGGLFLAASLTCACVLVVDVRGRLTPFDWPILWEILVRTTALFFLPCALLGMISPIVIKLAVRDLAKTGSTVGRIYAAGTVGSIVGTFATGFVLIAWIGTYAIVLGLAAVLAAMGSIFLLAGRWVSLPLAAIVAVGGYSLAARDGWARADCYRETNYYSIRIKPDSYRGEPMVTLILDRLVHSTASLAHPTRLAYEYTQVYAEVAADHAQKHDRLRTLSIGGGGYAFPRYLEAVYPASDVEVIEIDPGVTQVAYEVMGLRRDTRIVTYNEDARLYLAREPGARYDLIMNDACNHYSIPYHLTTKEFDDRVHAWLAEDGVYMVNLMDVPTAGLVRAFVLTLQQTFRYVYLLPTAPGWRAMPRSTFVVLASDAPLDRKAFAKIDAGDGDPIVARQLFTDDQLRELMDAGGPRIVLTDRYAPVEQLSAAVAREQWPKSHVGG